MGKLVEVSVFDFPPLNFHIRRKGPQVKKVRNKKSKRENNRALRNNWEDQWAAGKAFRAQSDL